MMKKVLPMIAVILIVMFSIALLSGCGEEKTAETEAEKETNHIETTAVIETTSEGGTVEQDSEGNKITRNSDGKIVSVEDKDGNTLNIDEYLTVHTWVEEISSSASTDPKNETGSSGNDQQNKPTKNSSGNTAESEFQDEVEEESIPVIIATIPDDQEMIDLPDI